MRVDCDHHCSFYGCPDIPAYIPVLAERAAAFGTFLREFSRTLFDYRWG